MDSIDLTIYLVDDIVSGPVCMLQVVYLNSNTLITIGCQPDESQLLTILLSCVFLPPGRKKSFGICTALWTVFLCPVVVAGWTDQLESYFLCEKNKPFMLCFFWFFVEILFLYNVFDWCLFCEMLPIVFIAPRNIRMCIWEKDACL